jgi:hypothetical protein
MSSQVDAGQNLTRAIQRNLRCAKIKTPLGAASVEINSVFIYRYEDIFMIRENAQNVLSATLETMEDVWNNISNSIKDISSSNLGGNPEHGMCACEQRAKDLAAVSTLTQCFIGFLLLSGVPFAKRHILCATPAHALFFSLFFDGHTSTRHGFPLYRVVAHASLPNGV